MLVPINLKHTNLIYFIRYICDLVPKYILNIHIFRSQICFSINPIYIIEFCTILKYHVLTLFESLSDLTIIDTLSNNFRFHVVYNFFSYTYNFRCLVRTELQNVNPFLGTLLIHTNSLTSLFNSANWLERECWDMFGVFFKEHPDLRRILTDYGFDGFPLRKDFPLSGFLELSYNDITKTVIYTPIELSQDFRFFELTGPWDVLMAQNNKKL
jgi:NADH:ubiquinone oxidoreductase subunit C